MAVIVHHLEESRSQRILWLLEELGVDYEVKRYARNAQTRLAPPELKAIHPLGRRIATLGAAEVKAMPFGDIGDIGFHPSLFFAGICGPGFQAALQLFGIDACQSGVEAQICPKAFGPAVLELGLCATNHQSCRADGGAVYR